MNNDETNEMNNPEVNYINSDVNNEEANSNKGNSDNNNDANTNMKFEKEPQSEEEREIQILKKKIENQKVEINENEDRIKRLMAEFENFKKRSEKERAGMYSSVMGDVITTLLPVIDNLEKAVIAETQDTQYKSGVEMVLKQFKDVLTSNGVKEIEAVGKTFDPSLHEAVSLVSDEKLGIKEVKEEFRKGYMIGDKVLRHSLVVVAN